METRKGYAYLKLALTAGEGSYRKEVVAATVGVIDDRKNRFGLITENTLSLKSF